MRPQRAQQHCLLAALQWQNIETRTRQEAHQSKQFSTGVSLLESLSPQSYDYFCNLDLCAAYLDLCFDMVVGSLLCSNYSYNC